MNRSKCIVLLLFSLCVVWAGDDSQKPKDLEILSRQHYQVVMANPIMGIDLNYESIFKQKNGIALGAFYQYFKERTNYNFRLYYRRYYSKENLVKRKSNTIMGTIVKSVGPMIQYKHLESTARDEYKDEHDYSATYLCPGFHIHKRRVYRSGLILENRIGYGFPIEVEAFRWRSTKPDEGAGIISDFTRGLGGLDLGLLIGFTF